MSIVFSTAFFALISSSSLYTIEDKAIELAELKKDVTLIDFWATWCMSCQRSWSVLDSLKKKFSGKKVKFYAVSMDDSFDELKRFVQIRNRT